MPSRRLRAEKDEILQRLVDFSLMHDTCVDRLFLPVIADALRHTAFFRKEMKGSAP